MADEMTWAEAAEVAKAGLLDMEARRAALAEREAEEYEPGPPPVRRTTLEVLAWAGLKDFAAKGYEEARARQLLAMDEAGSEKQRGLAADGTDLGSVTLRRGEWVAEVADPGAFLDWVIDKHPTEYETPAPVLRVRKPFEQKVLDEAARTARKGDEPPELPPGVRVVWKPAGITVVSTPAMKESVARALTKTVREAIEQ